MHQPTLEALWHAQQQPALADGSDWQSMSELSIQDGQRLQLALLQRWQARGETLGGWKIGMTSGQNRNALGDGIRPFGFLLAGRILPSGSTLGIEALHRGQVENELCFLMGTSLGAGATAGDAAAAVAAVLPAFEINQKRLPPQAPPGLRVADNLSNWGIVIGDPVHAPAQLGELRVTLRQRTGIIEQVASAGHIDDHYESLAVLANTLAEHDLTLSPGQYVITGAYGKTAFAPGSYYGHFDLDIGEVTVHLHR